MEILLKKIVFLSFLVSFLVFLNFGAAHGQEAENNTSFLPDNGEAENSVSILLDNEEAEHNVFFLLDNEETENSVSSPLDNNETKAGKYSFILSPVFGLLLGHSDEILYKNNTGNQYVSQLVWDLKPSLYAGISAEFGPGDPYNRSGFLTEGFLKFGFPMKTGNMEDKDWKYTDNDDLTHYSRHDAHSVNTILGDISAGYLWKLKENLTLSLTGELTFMYFFWSAEDGYFQHLNTYPDGTVAPGQTWSSSIPKEYLNGPVIQYNQVWLIFSPGFSLKGRFDHRFCMTGQFNYSPLVYGADKDDHLLPYTIYNPILMEYERYEGKRHSGQFFGGHYFNVGGNFIFSVKQAEMVFSISYRYIAGLRGVTFFQDIYIMQNTSNPVYRNVYDGGMGYSAIDMGLFLKFNFLKL